MDNMSEKEYKRRVQRCSKLVPAGCIGSWSSSGTKFLQRRLAEVGRRMAWILPTPHTPYDESRSSEQPHNNVIIIYADPRDSFISLMTKANIERGIRGRFRTNMGAHLENFGYTPTQIMEFESTRFLDSTRADEWRTVWSQFDGFHQFFNTWLSASRGAPTRFIKYEYLRDPGTITALGQFLKLSPQQVEELSERIKTTWVPRKSSYEALDLDRQEFLNNHFADLLETQQQLAPFASGRGKNNG
jgi:hypothetical protein